MRNTIEHVLTFFASNEVSAMSTAEELMEWFQELDGRNAYAGHVGACDGVRREYVPVYELLPTPEEAKEWLFGSYNSAGILLREGFADKFGPAILVQVQSSRDRPLDTRWMIGGVCPS